MGTNHDEKTKAAFDELLNYNAGLRRKETKLKKSYNELLEKYKRLSKELGKPCDSIETDNCDDFKEVDVNGKYIFVADPDKTDFVSKIKNSFPNSVVTCTPYNLVPRSIDMVIIITSIMGHSVYNAFKTQCKNKNIPMIHCPSQNVDIIKRTMESYINSI